jgi:AcrR family transcriptional regulator
MTAAHRRKKQPDVVRSDLIRSAAEIAATEGVGAVTLDAVAARAGVTRGGLQHHFSSKHGLLEALFCEMRDEFEREIATEAAAHPQDHNSMTRAYIRVTTKEVSRDGKANAIRALVALLLTQPDLRDRWAAWRKQAQFAEMAAEEDPELAICRLAADGLWMSNLLSFDEISPALRSKIVLLLEQKTRSLRT